MQTVIVKLESAYVLDVYIVDLDDAHLAELEAAARLHPGISYWIVR